MTIQRVPNKPYVTTTRVEHPHFCEMTCAALRDVILLKNEALQ